MAQIYPYIHFNGNAEAAFGFYRSVFGGEFKIIKRYGDLSIPGYTIPHNDVNRIMHIALPIGKNGLLLGSDVMEAMGEVSENDNRNAVFLSSDSREEAERLFSGLSEGGKIEMPLSDGPAGSYFGMLNDRYGVEWMVDYAE